MVGSPMGTLVIFTTVSRVGIETSRINADFPTRSCGCFSNDCCRSCSLLLRGCGNCCCCRCCYRGCDRGAVAGRSQSFTLVVVSFYEGAVGSLPDAELAVVVRRPVESLLSDSSLGRELRHVVTEQLLPSDVHTEPPGEVSVVPGSVLGIRIVSSALYPSIDDHCGDAKSRNQIGGEIVSIGNPGAVQHLQHAWLGRLRSHEEPHGGSKVQPSGGN